MGVGSLSTVFAEPIELNPAPLSTDVQSRFLEAFSENAGFDRLLPGFHGTDASLHESIFNRGLLIPGRGNELRVLHGSAHGLGIYTANVLSPWLSKGFCTAPRMLVCGILDEKFNPCTIPDHWAGWLFPPPPISTNPCSLAKVQHVGSAVVIFDSCRVAPLFEASGSAWKGEHAM